MLENHPGATKAARDGGHNGIEYTAAIPLPDCFLIFLAEVDAGIEAKVERSVSSHRPANPRRQQQAGSGGNARFPAMCSSETSRDSAAPEQDVARGGIGTRIPIASASERGGHPQANVFSAGRQIKPCPRIRKPGERRSVVTRSASPRDLAANISDQRPHGCPCRSNQRRHDQATRQKYRK